MSPQQKHQAITNLHQWFTLIFLPVIALLLGDMYRDFKQTRDKVIMHTEKIQEHDRRINNIEVRFYARK